MEERGSVRCKPLTDRNGSASCRALVQAVLRNADRGNIREKLEFEHMQLYPFNSSIMWFSLSIKSFGCYPVTSGRLPVLLDYLLLRATIISEIQPAKWRIDRVAFSPNTNTT